MSSISIDMKSVSEIVLEVIERTRQRFIEDCGKHHENEKEAFIKWYVNNHRAPLEVMIHDLSEYYLHISENRIVRILKS